MILPNSVKYICYSAFLDCDNLESINIPNGLNVIREQAFKNCKSLKSITIPDSVTSIEKQAFRECSSLKSVYCKATTPPDFMGAYHFKGRASDCKFYVPRNSVEAYKNDVSWKQFADNIVGYDF